jgi:hypothetical protein
MKKRSDHNKPMKKDNPIETSDTHKNEQQTTIFQANQFNIAPGIDPAQIALLSKTDKELADQLIEIEKKRIDHLISVEDRILKLEENEQTLRKEEMPHIRKFMYRGQTGAIVITVAALGSAIVLAYLGATTAATTAILVAGGSVAINLLGRKNKDQV